VVINQSCHMKRKVKTLTRIGVTIQLPRRIFVIAHRSARKSGARAEERAARAGVEGAALVRGCTALHCTALHCTALHDDIL
jgi:hypothetical protein